MNQPGQGLRRRPGDSVAKAQPEAKGSPAAPVLPGQFSAEATGWGEGEGDTGDQGRCYGHLHNEAALWGTAVTFVRR